MSYSTFGNIFRVTTFGESHGIGLGAVIDGCPAGLSLTKDDIQKMLNRRRPGQNKYTSPRNENDFVKILSGVFNDKTLGTPISLVIMNKDQISKDYSNIAKVFRPGHSDFGYEMKYGYRDYRGGGRSSGRETIGRVCGGAIAKKALEEIGIEFITYTASISNIKCENIDYNYIEKSPINMPDKDASEKACKIIDEARLSQNSLGGSVKCIIKNVPYGLGDPVFGKADAILASACMSIGACKAIEIGNGIKSTYKNGFDNNDCFVYKNGDFHTTSNNCGGILGGITTGGDIELTAYFKPTPSVSLKQQTANVLGENIDISIHGRHDPCIVSRANVVVESMCAISIFDMLLKNMSSKMNNVIRLYKK